MPNVLGLLLGSSDSKNEPLVISERIVEMLDGMTIRAHVEQTESGLILTFGRDPQETDTMVTIKMVR